MHNVPPGSMTVAWGVARFRVYKCPIQHIADSKRGFESPHNPNAIQIVRLEWPSYRAEKLPEPGIRKSLKA